MADRGRAAEVESDWLAVAHEIAAAAAQSRRMAASLERRADYAFRKAGVRCGEPKEVDRILWNERPTSPGGGGGDIDEIVLHNVTVHVEQMDGRCWWIGVYRGDDRFAGNFSCDSRGRMSFSMQEDDLPWDLDESHEDRS